MRKRERERCEREYNKHCRPTAKARHAVETQASAAKLAVDWTYRVAKPAQFDSVVVR